MNSAFLWASSNAEFGFSNQATLDVTKIIIIIIIFVYLRLSNATDNIRAIKKINRD